MEIKELRKKGKTLSAQARIGKEGVTEGISEEIKRQLRQKGLVKVKMLPSFIKDNDKKKAAEEIAEKTDSILVERVGFVAVLGKKYKNTR